jgi:hypothetical protein
MNCSLSLELDDCPNQERGGCVRWSMVRRSVDDDGPYIDMQQPIAAIMLVQLPV